jgi:plastocyanin
MLRQRVWRLVVTATVLWLTAAVLVHGTNVTGRFSISDQNKPVNPESDATAVVWLVPASSRPATITDKPKTTPRRLTLLQKSKRFDPHIMVVEVGTVVDFPNRDPFFHNVFSLFDGKRFDLGLYEAGATRNVRFDRPGVCYIFCNIHPEMSAVVVVVNSPHYSISKPSGEFAVPDVPPGRYQLNVWAEHSLPKTLKDLSREVIVGEDPTVLGTIHLETSRELFTIHPNKYGKSYDPQVFSSPTYLDR